MNVVLPWAATVFFVILFIVFYYQSRVHSWLASPLMVTVFGVPVIVLTRARVLTFFHTCALLPMVTLMKNWKF
jgi:hypothetical protein